MTVLDGSVVCWGSGEHGQHGHGNGVKLVTAESEVILNKIKPDIGYSLACGSSHSICICKDIVHVWGNGADGQLGTGSLADQATPVRIHMPCDLKANELVGVSCGASHSVIWTNNGLCFGFGSNSNGQLALSFEDNKVIEKQSVPKLLSSIQHIAVKLVACGGMHTLFLYQCGTVAGVGNNNYGQIGIGSRNDCLSPIVLQDLENVKLISCGDNHSLAVTESGELYSWGYGKALGFKYKDIVIPTKSLSHYTNITQLAGGAKHSLALTENGNVYSWGSGEEGQLGHGEDTKFLTKPTKILRDFLPTTICQISAGSFFSLALSVDGVVYIWGNCQHIKPVTYSQANLYHPIALHLPRYHLGAVSCGTWHVAAVVGPSRQVNSGNTIILELDEEISDENNDDSSTTDNSSIHDNSETSGRISSIGYNSGNLTFAKGNFRTDTHNSFTTASHRQMPIDDNRKKYPDIAQGSDESLEHASVLLNSDKATNSIVKRFSGSPHSQALMPRGRAKTTLAEFYAPEVENIKASSVVLGNNVVSEEEESFYENEDVTDGEMLFDKKENEFLESSSNSLHLPGLIKNTNSMNNYVDSEKKVHSTGHSGPALHTNPNKESMKNFAGRIHSSKSGRNQYYSDQSLNASHMGARDYGSSMIRTGRDEEPSEMQVEDTSHKKVVTLPSVVVDKKILSNGSNGTKSLVSDSSSLPVTHNQQTDAIWKNDKKPAASNKSGKPSAAGTDFTAYDKNGSALKPTPLGFLQLSDISLVEKKLQNLQTSPNSNERHLRLYNQEMALRNKKFLQHNMYINRSTVHINNKKYDVEPTVTDMSMLASINSLLPSLKSGKVEHKVNRRVQLLLKQSRMLQGDGFTMNEPKSLGIVAEAITDRNRNLGALASADHHMPYMSKVVRLTNEHKSNMKQ